MVPASAHPPYDLLPLSLPALGLLALFTFTGQWNSFLWPLIVVNGTDTRRCRWDSRCSRARTERSGTT